MDKWHVTVKPELKIPLQVSGIRVTGECSVETYKENLGNPSRCYAGILWRE